MQIGYQRGLSERELASMREFKAFCEAETVQQRETEDREAYARYLQSLSQEQATTPRAYRIRKLSFEEWRQNLPENEPDPIVRGLIGTQNALTKAHVAYFRDKVVNQSLEQSDLQELGFSLHRRPTDRNEINPILLRQAYDSFRALYPEYQHELHFNELSDFINAYNIDPTLYNLQAAFAVLWHLHVIEPKPVEPESEPTSLTPITESAPELDRDEARRRYREEIVVTDPRTGQGYTQYQLDHVVDADTFKRLVIGEFKTPTIRDVIKPGLK